MKKQLKSLPKKSGPLNSSNIDSISYDPISKLLTVGFKKGQKYQYENVDPQKYVDFVKSTSKGEFLHKHIIPKHTIWKKS